MAGLLLFLGCRAGAFELLRASLNIHLLKKTSFRGASSLVQWQQECRLKVDPVLFCDVIQRVDKIRPGLQVELPEVFLAT